MTDLKKLFDDWGAQAKDSYGRKQWLLSKWDNLDGVEWPEQKIAVMVGTLVEGLELKRQHLLADLGCGGGWILARLQPFAGKTLGLDFSLPMIDAAKTIAPQASLICGGIGQLPFAGESIDRALSYFVFLNFMDDCFVRDGLKDIYRVLKPGGRALIGQLPDKTMSARYDEAKAGYLRYCEQHFSITKSNRETCQAPQKLFDRGQLDDFLTREQVPHHFRESFNPFYRDGEPETVTWRFDLILEKP